MAGRGEGPDFVEALARGLDVLCAFNPTQGPLTLADVAAATELARPTARRLLLTLEELGYVRNKAGYYELTPRVLRLGMAYVTSEGIWDLARPHLEDLVRRTGESSSMSELDGSDIVYVARVAVPKIISIQVSIGTVFPAWATSQGKVLLAALPEADLTSVLQTPTRSTVLLPQPDLDQLRDTLRTVRARGWALADEELAPGVRSVAVPVRDGQGVVRAATNVTVHAAETSVETLTQEHLPRLLAAAAAIPEDWALWQSRPQSSVGQAPGGIRRHARG